MLLNLNNISWMILAAVILFPKLLDGGTLLGSRPACWMGW